ncbi:MAG: phosphoethanolamine methyltransferase, partial [Rhodospirillaceae bacterium]
PHRMQILAAIKSLTEHLEKHYLDKETKINVIDEVETWAQRVAALGAGLKCYRFYALKAPE